MFTLSFNINQYTKKGIAFLPSHPHIQLQKHQDQMRGFKKSHFLVNSSPWQCVYWFNYLKVMPVFACMPLYLSSLLSRLLVNPTTRITLFQPPHLFGLAFRPFGVCPPRDPLPLLVRRHLAFITARPWLSLLFSLLWCSITLSSWGKHWCQATVMTFWLSVFMWWMRWKCTTTAKLGLAPCQTATQQSGAGGSSKATNNK